MKILVTGGAGFIGSSFAVLALARGHEVTVLDALTYSGNLRNLDGAKPFKNYSFARGNILDEDLVLGLLRQHSPDCVVNFAAETHVDRSIMSAAPFVSTNVDGVRSLLDATRRYLAESPKNSVRYLQVSTDECFGSADDGKPFSEESPLRPSSPYSATKTAGDLLALAYHRTYGMDVVVTRCSNNYGPCQFPEKLIPLFVTNLLQGEKVPLYGDGLNVRDWIHRDDHSDGILAALERGKPGEVYNFGGGTPLTNLHITRTVLRLTGYDESMIRRVKDRPGHDRIYLVNFDKARSNLGWEPKIEFEQGISDTVQWYKDNEDWWKEVKSGEYLKYYAKQYGTGN
jgi:dTDP-glucose 4,6-dehydratase